MFKLSPSDFAYLYEECKLCYYLKIKHGIYQPSMPMPGVFSAINTRLQGKLVGQNLHTLSSSLPPGLVESQEGWVESIVVPGTDVFIKGKYDLLVRLEDGTHMIVDLKISQADEGKIEKYKTQLGAYKFALENPKVGKPLKISKMGLLIFYPDAARFEKEEAVLTFPPKFLNVPIDDKLFLEFADKIDKLLAGKPPAESISCKWCQYRHVGDQLAHVSNGPVQDDLPF